MSEMYHGPEHHKGSETKAEHQAAPEAHHEHAERGKAEKQPANAEQARLKAETAAKPKEEIMAAADHGKDQAPREEFIGQDARELTFQRTMLKIRRHLSPVSRAASKLIHQPIVDSISEATGKTAARPSGLLGGGIVAFVGTSLYYVMVRHYGYSYSFSVYLVLLVAGFVVGWLIEALWRSMHRSK